jgi:hypothetical protein
MNCTISVYAVESISSFFDFVYPWAVSPKFHSTGRSEAQAWANPKKPKMRRKDIINAL